MIANAARHGSYGINGSYFSYGNMILANYYPDVVFLANYLAGGSSSRYPAGTLVSGTFPSQFADATGGDFTVVTGSILQGAAPDGSDIGVDYPALAARLDGVATGVPSGNDPPPPPQVPPTAVLSFACTYLECAFADASTAGSATITSRVWTFGDGTTSTASSGAHTYAAAGTYTVTLVVTDANGLSDADATTVAVAAPAPNTAPAAAFDWSCVDLTCNFLDRSTDSDGLVVSRMWTFGSAGTSTSPSPSFRFPSPGTYPVSLTVADDDAASATTTTSIEVRAAIHSAIVAAGTEIGGNRNNPSWWKATVTTEVHGADERPIAGATITAAWSGSWSKTVSCVTDTAGRCTFRTSPLGVERTSVTFTVTSVAAPLSVYASSASHNGAGKRNQHVHYRGPSVTAADREQPPIASRAAVVQLFVGLNDGTRTCRAADEGGSCQTG
jgi:PKD repeat protein